MKKSIIINVVAILAAGAFAITNISQASAKQEHAKAEVTRLTKKHKKARAEMEDLQKYVDQLEVDAEKYTTGLSSKLQKADSKMITSTFKPVFTWKSGADYDDMRSRMIDQFGADNSFVDTYIPENIKIEVPDGVDMANNDIDLNNMKSEVKTFDIYPTSWDKDGMIKYLVIVEYQLYQEKMELSANNMKTEMAYLEFTMSGDNRQITDLKGLDVVSLD